MNINRETADLAVAEASDQSRPSLDAHLLRGDEAFEAFGSSKDGISSDEAKSRLEMLWKNGSTPQAFTFRKRFDAIA